MDPTPAAALMDEIVEEVLVRIPPDDPASLVRAALVCKRWRRLISGPTFRRRFRELHPTPPMLGFLYRRPHGTDFVPTSYFRPRYALRSGWRVLDARHGRVLVLRKITSNRETKKELLVWDPLTNEVRRLPWPRILLTYFTAVFLCATAGCDHLNCRGGAFLVLFVETNQENMGRQLTTAFVYSSEQGVWREPICLPHNGVGVITKEVRRALVVGNALYVTYTRNTSILEYDLDRQQLTMIEMPSQFHGWRIVLMEAEDGGLGFATIQDFKLSTWSRVVGPNGSTGWAQQRVLELDKLQPASDFSILLWSYVLDTAQPPYVIDVAGGAGVFFVWTVGGLFTIHLKSSRVDKIGDTLSILGVVPYVTFCFPALALASTGGVGPRAGALSASQT